MLVQKVDDSEGSVGAPDECRTHVKEQDETEAAVETAHQVAEEGVVALPLVQPDAGLFRSDANGAVQIFVSRVQRLDHYGERPAQAYEQRRGASFINFGQVENDGHYFVDGRELAELCFG